ncbi:MAG TPA: MaoC/PaaZ C-terminal domain-containing protein [Baekduia sp.]|nr:MaoC/PaaZ C-terminal domain-containing protein [Baekduia sp.]
MQIETLKITPDRYTTVRYAGASGDFNPIHLDDEFARRVGLPGRILHGLWTMAQVARATTESAGGPGSLQSLEVTFRGMGFPEQELTITGTAGDDGIDLVVEQNGTTIIRRATATLNN